MADSIIEAIQKGLSKKYEQNKIYKAEDNMKNDIIDKNIFNEADDLQKHQQNAHQIVIPNLSNSIIVAQFLNT